MLKCIKKYDLIFSIVGFWGFCGMTIALVIFFFIPIADSSWAYDPTPPFNLEDALDGFIQLGNNPLLLVAILGTVFSIAFFNFAGLTVTQELSATTRMVLDSVRTLVIWLFSIIIGWQKFQYLQVSKIYNNNLKSVIPNFVDK